MNANGKLAQDIEAVDKNSGLNFDLSLYIPIFSQTPGDIQFEFSESGPLSITSNIQLQGKKIKHKQVVTLMSKKTFLHS